MRTSLRHLSASRRNDLTLVVRHVHDAFQSTRASGRVVGLGRKLRRAADLTDPEMIVLFGAHGRLQWWSVAATTATSTAPSTTGTTTDCANRSHRANSKSTVVVVEPTRMGGVHQ